MGKFCSCCGQRVRSEAEEIHLIERKLYREFKQYYAGRNAPLYCTHLAEACWLAAVTKYRKDIDDHVSYIEAVNSLDEVKYAARGLFQKLKDF